LVFPVRPSLLRIGAITLTLAWLAGSALAPRPAGAATYVTDGAVHAPPTTGTYAYYASYGTFGPDQSGFPRVGQTFVDPVFGSTIRRLTNDMRSRSDSEIYSKNGYFNADGTLMHHRTPSGHAIVNTTTGQVVRSGVAFNYDSSFAPDNPDVWYSFAKGDTTLYRYSVATGARTVLTRFPGALGDLGGSVDWIDRSGRYMVLHIGGATRVYDRQTDSLYAGSIPGSYGANGGWRGISPDGNYVITSTPPTSSHSWRIDHANQRVSTTPVLFWTLCGGHGDVVSASNGRTYYVTFDCHTTGSIYRADVALPQSAANVSQQLSQNKKLVQLASWSDVAGHFSRVSKGALRDWVFASVESGDDGFSSRVTTWRPYKQEILMMNVLTGEVRRLAHHRSRGLSSSYYAQPRVSATWDGRLVAWASNFGLDDSGYADIYALTVGTVSGSTGTSGGTTGGGTSGGTTGPGALSLGFQNPASGTVVSGTVTVTVQASGGSGSGYTYTVSAASSPAVQIYSGTNNTVSWNTTASPNGAVMLTATVKDGAGNTASTTRTVTVSNTTAGTPSSGTTVRITAPTSGVWTGNSIQVGAAASGGSLARLELWGAGRAFATIPCSGGSCSGSTWWITGPLAPAAYQVSAVAVDTSGARTVSAPVTINKDATSPVVASGAGSSTVPVTNSAPPTGGTAGGTTGGTTGTTGDATPPTVAITSPRSGVWTGNSLVIAVSATDNVALRDIQLSANGAPFGTVACSGTSCSGSVLWLSGSFAAGTHTVTARARDQAGNTRQTSITVYK
jgi:hypothetical protein